MLMRSFLLSLSAFALSSLVHPQSVLVIDDDPGPGVDFNDVQPAIDAAPANAVLLVRSGSYGGATIVGKPLTLTRETNGLAVLRQGLTIRDLGEGDHVTVRGLGVLGAPEVEAPVMIENNAGQVWIEQVVTVVTRRAQGSGIRIIGSDGVTLRRTTVRVKEGYDAYAGIWAENATLYLSEVDSRGPQVPHVTGSTAGVRLEDSFLYAMDGHFEGGTGGLVCYHGCFPAEGGHGLVLWSGSTAYLRNTTLLGGTGGEADGHQAEDGAPYIGGTPLVTRETSPGLSIGSPAVAGTQVPVTVQGAPGELSFLTFSGVPDAVFLPSFFASDHVGPGSASIFLGVIDDSGSATFDLRPRIPNGGLSRVFYAQSVHFDPNALAGERWRVGPPTAMILLAP